MEALKIISESWPIAAMVVGLTIAVVVYRLIDRNDKRSHRENMERMQGSGAVVVQHRDNAG
jgi:uncharacterized membrane-anchored protein YhcB (DUF1043 family)